MSSLNDKVRALLRPELRGLAPYHVQDAEGLIKLDAMENPYHWPPEMVEEWLIALRDAHLNRYPDASAARLKTALRHYAEVPDVADLMVGNGSDELIQLIIQAIAGGDAKVLAPEPTFVMYRQVCIGLGVQFVGVSLRKNDFSLDMSAMRESIARHRPSVIFLAVPNNPTGNAFDPADVLEIIRMAPGLVVVDEAYAPFADFTYMPLIQEFDHLLVMRTLSKWGLAGLRLGYLVGRPAWIAQLEKLRLPYNIGSLSQLTAEFALGKRDILDAQVATIRMQRTKLASQLADLPGVQVYPSQCNFLTFRLTGADAVDVFRALKNAGILVKNLSGQGGLLTNCLRVTVGTEVENASFAHELSRILA